MTSVKRELTEQRYEIFKKLGASIAKAASASISGPDGQRFEISEINSSLLRIERLVEATGDPNNAAVAVLSRVEGRAPGYAAFLFPYWKASALVAELETFPHIHPNSSQALRELGTKMISASVDKLSSETGINFRPLTPVMAIDMAWAIVSSVVDLADKSAEQALMVATRFGSDDTTIDGLFLYIFDSGSLETVEYAMMCKIAPGGNPLCLTSPNHL